MPLLSTIFVSRQVLMLFKAWKTKGHLRTAISGELRETRPETPAPSDHSTDDVAAEGESMIGTPLSSAETAMVIAEGAGPTPAEEPTVLGSTPTVPSSASIATAFVEEPSASPVPLAPAASRKRKRV
ncbi:hypothetical protein ACEPAI_6629 [Sanghuangporus weigelae]